MTGENHARTRKGLHERWWFSENLREHRKCKPMAVEAQLACNQGQSSTYLHPSLPPHLLTRPTARIGWPQLEMLFTFLWRERLCTSLGFVVVISPQASTTAELVHSTTWKSTRAGMVVTRDTKEAKESTGGQGGARGIQVVEVQARQSLTTRHGDARTQLPKMNQ